LKAASDFDRANASLSHEPTFSPACAGRSGSPVQFRSACPRIAQDLSARRGEAASRINLILARTVAVKVPTALVQHLAEGHDVKRAEGGGLGNTTAAVIHAVTTAAGKVKCRRANVSQGVAH
jgi:hypothetical protein